MTSEATVRLTCPGAILVFQPHEAGGSSGDYQVWTTSNPSKAVLIGSAKLASSAWKNAAFNATNMLKAGRARDLPLDGEDRLEIERKTPGEGSVSQS